MILLFYEVNINQSTIASLRQCKSKRKFDINNSRIWNIHIFYREGTFIHTGISIELIRSQKNGPSLDWDRPRFLTCRLWSINDGSSIHSGIELIHFKLFRKMVSTKPKQINKHHWNILLCIISDNLPWCGCLSDLLWNVLTMKFIFSPFYFDI